MGGMKKLAVVFASTVFVSGVAHADAIDAAIGVAGDVLTQQRANVQANFVLMEGGSLDAKAKASGANSRAGAGLAVVQGNSNATFSVQLNAVKQTGGTVKASATATNGGQAAAGAAVIQ